jgi:hypothetical protein
MGYLDAPPRRCAVIEAAALTGCAVIVAAAHTRPQDVSYCRFPETP